MPSWFQIPARYVGSGGDEDGIAIAINLDTVAFIVQDKAGDGKPLLKITTTSGESLHLHGVSLQAFLALSRTGFSADLTEGRPANAQD